MTWTIEYAGEAAEKLFAALHELKGCTVTLTHETPEGIETIDASLLYVNARAIRVEPLDDDGNQCGPELTINFEHIEKVFVY